MGYQSEVAEQGQAARRPSISYQQVQSLACVFYARSGVQVTSG